MFVENNMAVNGPLAVGRILAASMVARSALGIHAFFSDDSYLYLGIGAEFAGHCGRISGGLARKYQEGFPLGMITEYTGW
jgi:hypothetical protein